MKKQARQMIVVVVLFILFGAAYGGMHVYNQKQAKEERKQEEAEKIYIAGVKQEDITAFSYQNGEDTLEFVKEEDTWTARNDEELKLDQNAVETMLDEIALLEAAEVVEGAGDFSEYGFDTPENVITATTAEGTVTLNIGMENTVTGQYYLQKAGEDTLYLVSGSFPPSFEKSLADLEDTSEGTETVNETEAE